jgi:hypothetical protein
MTIKDIPQFIRLIIFPFYFFQIIMMIADSSDLLYRDLPQAELKLMRTIYPGFPI